MEDFINVEQLENLRGKAKRLDKIVTVLSVISFPLYIWLFYAAMIQEEMPGIFIAKLIVVAAVLSLGTFGLLWLIIAKHAYNKFNENFKTKYVVQTINEIKGFEDLRYYQKNGFSWDDVKNMGVVACGDKRYFESEDLLFGIYDNIRFKISDVTTKKMVRGNKRNKIKEIFSGQIICLFQFDDMKVSNGYLQIFEKEFLSNMSGWKAENEIHTENEIFNSRFSVYCYQLRTLYSHPAVYP